MPVKTLAVDVVTASPDTPVRSLALTMRDEALGDLVITDEMARNTAADIGDNASFRELPDCGHSPLIDDPETLAAELEAFLGESGRTVK